ATHSSSMRRSSLFGAWVSSTGPSRGSSTAWSRGRNDDADAEKPTSARVDTGGGDLESIDPTHLDGRGWRLDPVEGWGLGPRFSCSVVGLEYQETPRWATCGALTPRGPSSRPRRRRIEPHEPVDPRRRAPGRPRPILRRRPTGGRALVGPRRRHPLRAQRRAAGRVRAPLPRGAGAGEADDRPDGRDPAAHDRDPGGDDRRQPRDG